MFKIKDGLQLFNKQTTVRYPSGNYGSFEIDGGGKGNYEGFSIGGRVTFMHDNGTASGLYDDVNNKWMLLAYLNGETRLYHSGTQKLATKSGGVTVNGTLTADSLVGSINYNQISNPPSIPDGDLYVQKSGDTMTGALTMSGFTPINLGDGNHYLKKISTGYSGVTIDGPQLQGHQGGELTTNYQGDKWALRWNTSQDVHIGRNLHISGNNAYLGNGTGQSYLRIGDQVTDDNAGGWNKGVHLNAQYHGRFRIRTSDYNYGALETYYWADSSVSPSMGIYGNTSVFRFTGSITNILNKDNATFWHAGNDGSGSGLDADLLDGQHGSYYAPASHNHSLTLSGDVSGSGSVSGTISVSVNNDSHYHSQVYIPDTRGASRAPSYYPDRYVSFDFQNTSDTGAGGDDWNVLQTISPWSAFHSSHRQQQLAFTGTGGVKFRYASSDSAWTGWQTLWTSGNDGSGSGLDADLLDGKDHTNFGATLATYGTTGSTSRIRCTAPFNTNSGKMFQVTVSLYTSYTSHTYVVSAYMYSSTNQWYSPTAIYTGSGSPDIVVGRDANGKAYISIGAGSYTGVRVHNMTRGFYTSVADTYAPWTITSDSATENSVNVSVYNAMDKGWHAGNDGSGSGLDADLLDGIQGSSFLRSDTDDTFTGNLSTGANNYITFGPNSTWSSYLRIGGNGRTVSGANSASVVTTNGNLHIDAGAASDRGIYLNYYAGGHGTIFGNGAGGIVARMDNGGNLYKASSATNIVSTYWHSSNDGSGSGLDADLLDGHHASSTRNSANTIPIRDANGYLNLGWINTTSGNTTSTLTDIYVNTNDGYIRKATPAHFRSQITDGIYLPVGAKAADSELLDGIDSSRVVYGAGPYKSNSTSTFHNNVSGFHYYSAATSAPTAEWYNWITCRGNSWGDSDEYSFQLAHNFWNDGLYGRRTQSGTEQSWYKIWHSANDGSGSGLDADLLDGLDHSQFLRDDGWNSSPGQNADTQTTMRSDFTYSNNAPHTGELIRFGASGYSLQLNSSYNDATNRLSFRTYNNDSAKTWNAWRQIWHDGNDGSGSGLDADLLDGVQGSSFLRSDVADYINGNIYLRADITNETTHRDHGVYGYYDSTKISHIWSMGVNYRVPANGSSFGNLYGLAYKHTNNSTGGTMGGGHQMVWCQNGTPYAAMGSNIWTSGNVTAYSDRRVKTNLELIPNALEKVQQLNGYTFDRTDVKYDEEGEPLSPIRQTGVVAQEVLEVLPEAVTGSEGEHYSVAYGNMVGLLIEAIKEQQIQIEDLSSQLKSLKETN